MRLVTGWVGGSELLGGESPNSPVGFFAFRTII